MNLIKASALAVGCVLPLTATMTPACAELFDWTLTGPPPDLGGVPFPGSGTITATETSTPGVWDITDISGTINSSPIVGTSTFEGADNLVFTNGFAFVSLTGISFETAAGQNINIFSFFSQGTPPTGNAYGELTASPGGFGVGTFSLAAVPEPATWAMMLLGFVGLGFAGYRNMHKAASIVAAGAVR